MAQPKTGVPNPRDEQAAPELETLCPYCKGRGEQYEDSADPCFNCMGAGYVPTEFGKKVWAFLRHQSRATVDPA